VECPGAIQSSEAPRVRRRSDRTPSCWDEDARRLLARRLTIQGRMPVRCRRRRRPLEASTRPSCAFGHLPASSRTGLGLGALSARSSGSRVDVLAPMPSMHDRQTDGAVQVRVVDGIAGGIVVVVRTPAFDGVDFEDLNPQAVSVIHHRPDLGQRGITATTERHVGRDVCWPRTAVGSRRDTAAATTITI
jgi:hypothetical protein